MNITVEEYYHLRSFGRIDVHDAEKEKTITVIEELDSEAKDVLLRSPYGKGIELSDDEARVTNWDYYGGPRIVDRVNVSVISGNSTIELTEYFHTITRALKRKEKMFLESYGSEEEFTVAANLYGERYKLVSLSYNFDGEGSRVCAAVWEAKTK